MARIPGKFDLLNVARIFFFLMAMVFLLYCMSHHLPWRDEYQTFLVSTRTKTWAEFWTATKYERTPPLHYLLQRFTWPLLNGFVDPRTFIRLITMPFTFLTAYLVFFRFRFSIPLALTLVMSVYFFREWGMISRSYAIGGALLLLSLDLKNRGKETASKIILALSAATHLLFLAGSGTVLFLEYVEDAYRRGLRGRGKAYWLTVVAVLFIFAVLTIHAISPPDAVFAATMKYPIEASGVVKWVGRYLRLFSWTLLPIEVSDVRWFLVGKWEWGQTFIRFAWAFLFLIPLLFYFKKDRDLLVRLGIVTFPIFFIFLSAYAPALRHVGVLFVMLVYFMAQREFRSKERSKSERLAPYFLTGGSFLASLYWLLVWNPVAPRFSFSDSPNLAPLFKGAGVIYTVQDFTLFPAMAESGRNIYDVKNARTVAYPSFRKGGFDYSTDDFCRDRAKYGLLPGDLFVSPLVESGEVIRSTDHCGFWDLIYQSPKNGVTDETFNVYRYRGDGGG